MKCSQLFHSKDAAGCMQCNPNWGGEESLVGYLSDITGSDNPNLNIQPATRAPAQIEFDYQPLMRTGT